MDLVDSLNALAAQNRSGIAFLGAYGLTWIICAVVWLRTTKRTAAYVTLFQGLVAFPLALGISAAIGALGSDRPVSEAVTQLSILIGTSQLLGLPFLIYLIVKQQYRIVPFAFAAITAMHFVLYAWLYRTPLYIVMAALIALGTMAVMLTAPEGESRAGPARVSFLTGGLLLATGLVFLIMHAL